uniref:Uncharacterized protein n=1 Tax=Daphnia galeata TaxID=27404 RepID=A0A8J2RTI9_9CRUS|nr:unnamed protein product [Daphnia galeata]
MGKAKYQSEKKKENRQKNKRRRRQEKRRALQDSNSHVVCAVSTIETVNNVPCAPSSSLHASVKNELEDMNDKQPQLGSLKTQVIELLHRKSGVPGADALQDQIVSVSGCWKDRYKAPYSKFLEYVKDFHETHYQLSAWLTSQDRMMSVLGPISSYPRLVHHQLQQVQVLRDEFKAHEPEIQHLERLVNSIFENAESNSNDGRKVNEKLVSISVKWSNLRGRLEERKQNLDAAFRTSHQFYAYLGHLKDALQKISDNLEELAVENVYPEEILKHLKDLQYQLEDKRHLIACLKTIGEQLCALLSDATLKAEVAQKLTHIDKMHAQLQKKLGNRRSEIENFLKDNREFEDQCGQLQEWFGNCSHLLTVVYYDVNYTITSRAYKDVMDKEHKVMQVRRHARHLMLDKGQELANQSPNKSDAKAFNKVLERIHEDWKKVRQEIISRHRRLQTCLELCRKYDGSQETFISWLDKAEDKLNQMQPVAFKKGDLDVQEKELRSFRNDISRHNATFESNKSLGESFLSACDIDKEGVKSELTITKKRWVQINAAVLKRYLLYAAFPQSGKFQEALQLPDISRTRPSTIKACIEEPLKKKIKADPDAKPSNLSNFKSIIYIDLSSDEEN